MSVACAVVSAPSAGSLPCSARNHRAADTIADPHDEVPEEPPATDAYGNAVSPISTAIRLGAQPNASAAMSVSVVHAPVPMSAAPVRT